MGAARRRTARTLTPIATPESKPPANSSVYALTKYDQERMCLVFGDAYDVPTVALRFFNTYGPRQALSNPYTGVLAIFAARLLNGNRPLVFEDGGQRRDFVHVQRRRARMRARARAGRGERARDQHRQRPERHRRRDRPEARVASSASTSSSRSRDSIRAGDIRHCFADIALARELLGVRAGGRARGRHGRARRVAADADRGGPRRRARPTSCSAAGARAMRRDGDDAAPARGSTGHSLVTGGAGFVGTNLASRLLDDGRRRPRLRRPLAAGRRAEPALPPRDLRRPRRVRARERPRTASRCGARSRAPTASSTSRRRSPSRRASYDPVDDFRTNVEGTIRLLEELRRLDDPPFLLFTSTNKVYGSLPDVGSSASASGGSRSTRSSARTASRRTRPLALLHAVRLLEGRRRPVRARLRVLVRAAVRRVPHELHLRPAPARERGPGLGGALRDPRARRGADHALRRRRAGARHPLRRRPRRGDAARARPRAGGRRPRVQHGRRRRERRLAARGDRADRRPPRRAARTFASRDERAGDQRYYVADTRALRGGHRLAAVVSRPRRSRASLPLARRPPRPRRDSVCGRWLDSRRARHDARGRRRRAAPGHGASRPPSRSPGPARCSCGSRAAACAARRSRSGRAASGSTTPRARRARPRGLGPARGRPTRRGALLPRVRRVGRRAGGARRGAAAGARRTARSPARRSACAVNVVRRAAIEAGNHVAIVGMGFLGTAVARLVARGRPRCVAGRPSTASSTS